MEKQLTFQLENGGSIPTSPLDYEVKEISAFKASFLNKLWHSVLPKIHPSNIFRNTDYVCYGISYKNIIYGIAIWSSPVAQNRFNNSKEILELRRMAISDFSKKNFATRFLRVMRILIKRKFPHIKRLISYQDIEKHNGTIYKADNWVPVNKTKCIEWSNARKRSKLQTVSDKTRWEYIL